MFKSSPTITASFLIAGTCIGAGMLGVPVYTASLGLFPCIFINLFCWLFMTTTGLLLLEATLWLPPGSHYLSLTERLLGPIGKLVGGLLFALLYYAILVSYCSGLSPILSDLLSLFLPWHVDAAWGPAIFIVAFGGIIFLGATFIGRINTMLVIGLIVSFVLLITSGIPSISLEHYSSQHWGLAIASLPVLFTTYGYHNMIPTVAEYLQDNAKQLRISILMGTTIPFVAYVVWQSMVIGLATPEQLSELKEAGRPVTEILPTLTHNEWIGPFALFFSFFALVTSVIGVSFSMIDFIGDGLKLPKKGSYRLLLCFLVFIPPALFAWSDTSIFIKALSFAGGFGEAMLNALFPVLMVWRGRYILKLSGNRIIGGGRFTLLCLAAISLFVIFTEVLHLVH